MFRNLREEGVWPREGIREPECSSGIRRAAVGGRPSRRPEQVGVRSGHKAQRQQMGVCKAMTRDNRKVQGSMEMVCRQDR